MNNYLSYLALGDSYTIGEGVSEIELWPVQFALQLNEIGFKFSPPKIIAETGWTTSELMSAIDRESLTDTFDLATICIGVNNQYRGLDIEEYRNEFARLLQTALEFTRHKEENVIVLSIPDWGVTPFAKEREREKISNEIARFNIVKKEECDKMKISFIDITGLTKAAEYDSQLLAPDGLHYSGKMHKLWVDEIIKQHYKGKNG